MILNRRRLFRARAASGATEAEKAGAELADVSGGLTHTNDKTSVRYIRRRAKKIATVANARLQSRVAADDGGTA
ncbi:hypothetical protein [Bradyrhizobium sp.]|uniref:hypothetical protein n=1 Tax=Bradyrhizobium sp. TaxID=376 RepID=UPI003C7ABE9D